MPTVPFVDVIYDISGWDLTKIGEIFQSEIMTYKKLKKCEEVVGNGCKGVVSTKEVIVVPFGYYPY